MLIAKDLLRRVLLWPTEVTAPVSPPSRAGAVEGQTDPAAIIKGLVALGAADEGEQRLPRRTGIQPLGEIAKVSSQNGVAMQRARRAEERTSASTA